MAVTVITVIVIDDHPAIIDGLRHMLEGAPDIAVIGQAHGIQTGLALLEDTDPDVALVDVRLSDGYGTRLVEVVANRGRPAALVISSFAYPQYVAAALHAGAQGFLLKTSSRDDFEAAIRQLASGGTAFTADQLREAQRSRVVLSERERRIVGMLVDSRTNDEIAHELGLSRKTVEAALTRLFVRYDALSRTELAIRASNEGWLDV